MTNDDLPAQRHSRTSREAAKRAAPVAAAQRERVMQFLLDRGDEGATDDEVQAALAISGNAQRPRRVELVTAGRVRDSGRERPTRSDRMAVVWVAVTAPAGAES